MEEWKTIKNYPNYRISTYGRVYSIKRDIIMKPFHDGWGYLCIELRNEYGGKMFKVSRLVAKAFIPNPHNKPEVNHIDGNKENNRIDNLEWVTSSENKQHAFATGLNVRSSYDAGKPKRKIRDLDTGQIFNSIVECAEALGCTPMNVTNYLLRGGIYCMGHRLEALN